MGTTLRHFLFEEGGAIKRIPRRVVEGLNFGQDAIPAYAGTRQKSLEVIIDYEDGKPQSINHANGFYYEFDAEGRIDRSVRQGLNEIMSFSFPASQETDNVVALSKRRSKKAWRDVNRWEPSAQDLDRVLADIIRKPGTKAFPTIDGIAPRQPALSYEAKAAISKLQSDHGMWNWYIRQLSERALAGLIWEARSKAREDPEDQFLWEAVAAEGERQRELKRLRRTGRGQWVAVFQIFRDTGPSSTEEFFVEHRECAGEAAAVEAMKALITEHHGIVGPTMSIEARTMPALEWELMNGRPH